MISCFRIITYVLLCGYSPFHTANTKEVIEETTEGRIEFHQRYWKNISSEAKNFIKRLLQPDPAKRPTAAEASEDHWLTTHKPSTEHDLAVGLRENFDARAQWQSAITSARSLRPLSPSSLSRSSTASGGWLGDVGVDSDSVGDERARQRRLNHDLDPGENEHVHVFGAEEEEGRKHPSMLGQDE